MPSDALHYSFIADELNDKLRDVRIEKISMPEKDEIVLGIRSRGMNFSLLISASPMASRCHLTNHKKENPTVAPSFLMHLRKHIGGAKIISVDSPDFERIIRIKLLTRNEMSDEESKLLIAEIMGKYSNIILVGSNGIISDSIRHVGIDTSSKRQVLPGLKYEPAPAQNKLNPTATTESANALAAFPGGDLGAYIIAKFKGLAPSSAQEAVYRALQTTDCPRLTDEQCKKVAKELSALFDKNTVRPCVCERDFYIRPYALFGTQLKFCDSLNVAMDEYFYSRDKAARFAEKSKHLQSLLKNAIARTQKKLSGFIQKQESCKGLETDKLYGELILSNIYRIKTGLKSITVENWYDDNAPVTIELDPQKSPQANAQAYFKRYSKKKKTLEQLAPLIEKTQDELDYYDTVSLSFSLCSENAEIDELSDELERAGLIKRKQSKNKSVKKTLNTSSPLSVVIEGFTVRIGKNNIQNDALTKSAKNTDIWLHTKNIHGSHVIISTNGSTAPETVILGAARLAARYSKAAQSQNVPVDYTLAKYVSKPSGSPPGKVIYTHQSTIYVDPAERLS